MDKPVLDKTVVDGHALRETLVEKPTLALGLLKYDFTALEENGNRSVFCQSCGLLSTFSDITNVKYFAAIRTSSRINIIHFCQPAFKGSVMQIEKALINDRSRVLKVS